MNPTAIRDANFEQLRASLEYQLEAVYQVFVTHGPATTRRAAELGGIDLLTLRPRTHDLVQLGLLECTGETLRESSGRKHREGIYEARTPDEWARWQRARFPNDSQLQMGLNAGALTT